MKIMMKMLPSIMMTMKSTMKTTIIIVELCWSKDSFSDLPPGQRSFGLSNSDGKPEKLSNSNYLLDNLLE